MVFELRPSASKLALLQGSDPSHSNNEIVNINVEKLKHFRNHPFALYKGQRFVDMVESIKENGILNPLLVRPINEDEYEVLAGHNRLEAAKEISISILPCIIRDVNDEEAELILIETNLMQRSFSELTLSEQSYIIATYVETLKKQGKRNDLIKNVNNTLTLVHNEPKLAVEEASEKYDLNINTIKRYVRLNKLSKDLKSLLDLKELSMVAGVAISFLTDEQQEETYDYLSRYGMKPSTNQAEELKRISKAGEWSNGTLKGVFFEEIKPIKSFKVKMDKFQKFFKPTQTVAEMEEKILKALEFYENSVN